MRRVVHLVEAGTEGVPVWVRPSRPPSAEAEAGALLCAATVAAAEGHEVVVVGGTRAGAWCASLGLARHLRVSAPLRSTRLTGPRIGEVLRHGRPVSAVVAWSHGLGRVAARWSPRSAVVLRADLRAGRMELVRGGAGPQMLGAEWSLGVRRLTRDAARARVGVHGGVPLIGVVGNGPQAAVALAYILGILRIAGVDAAGVVSRGTGGLARGLRHVRETGSANLIVVEDAPSALVAGMDAAVLVPQRTGEATYADLLLANEWLRRGVPVVTNGSGAAAGLVEGDLGVCASRGCEHAHLAQAVHRLLTAPGALAGAGRAAVARGSACARAGDEVVSALGRAGVA